MKNKVLIIGSGGREDALLWKLSSSKLVSQLFAAPGNGGSERFSKVRRLDLDYKNAPRLIQTIKNLEIDFVIIGSEEPLAEGLVDTLEKANILAYGPSKKASRLEKSKAFAIQFMRKYKIPHPKSAIFTSYKKASAFIKNKPSFLKNGFVVKADGLAKGKGVFVCNSEREAIKALDLIMIKKAFGEAGNKVIIQEKLIGFEVSAMAISDGKKYLLLPFSQDHKQVYDHDLGPNTGGMGVVAPHQKISRQLAKKIEQKIISPTILGMQKEGVEFKGTLYPGLMIVDNEPFVLEYNVRFGDPEIEAVLPLLEDDCDFFEVLKSAAKGRLISNGEYPSNKSFCVAVTLASGGYPEKYKTGKTIYGLNTVEEAKNIIVFHAGTRKEGGKVITSGGRVLMVAGLGRTTEETRKRAYKAIGKNGVYFNGMHYRKDIGRRRS